MQNKTFEINLEKDRPIINILGEICWGFQVDNFEKKIGVKKETVEILLEKLLKSEREETLIIYINFTEVEIIKKAIIEVVREIEQWEFHARIGISMEELMKIPFFEYINITD
ncbi:MAG: hypothetical protein V4489_01590 [Chlamydiota bacterium]